MEVPRDRRYTETHEWHLVQATVVTIGITQFAADQLSDVTYVDLPAVGTELEAGKPFGEIESVKATSELYCGVGGRVVEVNDALQEHPEWVNQQPFADGWMIKVDARDLTGIETLMPAEEYEQRFSD